MGIAGHPSCLTPGCWRPRRRSHEDTKTGGIAGEITAIINEEAFDYLDGPVLRVTSLDTPVPYAAPLEKFFLPDVEKVLAASRKLAAY